MREKLVLRKNIVGEETTESEYIYRLCEHAELAIFGSGSEDERLCGCLISWRVQC